MINLSLKIHTIFNYHLVKPRKDAAPHVPAAESNLISLNTFDISVTFINMKTIFPCIKKYYGRPFDETQT